MNGCKPPLGGYRTRLIGQLAFFSLAPSRRLRAGIGAKFPVKPKQGCPLSGFQAEAAGFIWAAAGRTRRERSEGSPTIRRGVPSSGECGRDECRAHAF